VGDEKQNPHRPDNLETVTTEAEALNWFRIKSQLKRCLSASYLCALPQYFTFASARPPVEWLIIVLIIDANICASPNKVFLLGFYSNESKLIMCVL